MDTRLMHATSRLNNTQIRDINSILDSCRICMELSDNRNCIFDAGKQNIVEEIQFCTGIQLKQEDRLPSTICTTCVNNLSIAHKFKTLCLLTDETFKKIVSTNIKKEDPDSDVEYEDIEIPVDIEYDTKVKNELEKNAALTQNGVRKSGRIKLKKENSDERRDPSQPAKLPVQKSSQPRRLKKHKFRRLWCEPCNLQFDSKEKCDEHKLQQHKDSHHWICEICGKVFVHRASHYSHVKSHMPPRFACDQCDYKTWHKYDLVKHIRIHTGTKLYQCEYCTVNFTTSSNLTGHIRRSHTRLRPHACPLCARAFFDRTKLNRHMDSHNDIKRFECEICRACFTRRCYWKKHLLRHHNVTTPPQRPGRQKTNLVVGQHQQQPIIHQHQEQPIIHQHQEQPIIHQHQPII